MELSEFTPYYNLFNQIIETGRYLEVEVLVDNQDEETITDMVLIKDVYYGDGNLFVKYFSRNFQIILVVPHFYFKSILSYPLADFLDSDLLSKLLKDQSSGGKDVVGKMSQVKTHVEEQSPSPRNQSGIPQSIGIGGEDGLEGKFVFSVRSLTSRLKQMMEKEFYSVWVKGEVHDAKLSANGHMFFSLRDESASLSCVVYARQMRRLKFKIERGIVFECFGNLTLYEKRGVYQLVIEDITPEGQGDLDLAFKQLKAKLEQEGLFDLKRKKPIPKYPRRVGVITSARGAVLVDILKTTQTEFPYMNLIVFPCLVQGEKASESIASMIEFANQEEGIDLDLIILTRGGGSREDLWAFNEEITVRAISKSRVPIISAVGHEVDWTITDMVADYRCPTPTAAARFICKGLKDLEQEVFLLTQSLKRNFRLSMEGIKYRVKLFSVSHFSHLLNSMILFRKNHLKELYRRLGSSFRQVLLEKNNAISIIKVRLESLSPQKVFSRGYVVVKKNGILISDIGSLGSGDRVEISSYSKSKPARIL